jgi:alpha-glucan,water dikinase
VKPEAGHPVDLTEQISTRSGLALNIGKEIAPDSVRVQLRIQNPGKACVLHWGLRQSGQSPWLLPPPEVWPADTRVVNAAVQTPFAARNGYSDILIQLPASAPFCFIDFALFFPDQRAWDNNNGQNYRISLPLANAPGVDLMEAVRRFSAGRKVLFQREFELASEGRLVALLTEGENRRNLTLFTTLSGPLRLHWGIARYSSNDWFLPPPPLRPPGTLVTEAHSAQTPFTSEDGLLCVHIDIPQNEEPMGIQFVLQQTESNRWIKYQDGNFFVPCRLNDPVKASGDSPVLPEMTSQIILSEMGRNSWTLMHRFDLCHNLLDRAEGNPDALALLFVWLRYSALRQLTWQRNYNTKPRELSHAEDRLTQKLAALWGRESEGRPFVRLMLACVGPGGDGQRIRDEILNIMHRHHLKELSGHFLEEWHQKLHNNTTPDDIVICEAYLEFLSANGSQERFYQKLQEKGVSRQRLETFERPIRSQPDFVPHLKDALLHDFQNFLRILRAVHEGTDLETASNAARSRLDADTQNLLSRIREHRQGNIALRTVVGEITEARRRIHSTLQNAPSRELLYLDLALEQFFRTAVEYNLQQVTETGALAELIARALENRLLSSGDPELALCLQHWETVTKQMRSDADWALHAKSVVDRIARVLGQLMDRIYRVLQPKAELLGHAFHADAWLITLFSEEVVRGASLDFALSLLLHRLEPLLRKNARLGSWQVVSRGGGTGIVEVVDELRAVQGRQFDSPRVILADKVRGDEDIPESVTAVIAPDVTDIVSHVAVRARNAGLLFASCYDAEILKRIKALNGRTVRVGVNPAGDVIVEEAAVDTARNVRPANRPRQLKRLPAFQAWALSEAEFDPSQTGAKALNLRAIAAKLPDWIYRPVSIAVPFGIFEKTLGSAANKEIAREYEKGVMTVEAAPDRVLSRLRETILKLNAPGDLTSALRQKSEQARLPWPKDDSGPWECVKRVWASKWNDRAYFSRKSQSIAHQDLLMSVLIQQVVEADYAFVIHTVNPFTNNPGELYIEMVAGLGETLVGNYPGRALSAVCEKGSDDFRLLSYPGKSFALRGGGLIFRSDSNGEDLEAFAGAGLYDSVMLPQAKEELVDYSTDRLVWDVSFRKQILERLTELGKLVEKAPGSPQDIEGVLRKGQYYVVQTRPQVGIRHE